MASCTDHNHSGEDSDDHTDLRRNLGNFDHREAEEEEGDHRGSVQEADVAADRGGGDENDPAEAHGDPIHQGADRAFGNPRSFARNPSADGAAAEEGEGVDFGNYNRSCHNTDRNSNHRTRNLAIGLTGTFGVRRTQFDKSGV